VPNFAGGHQGQFLPVSLSLEVVLSRLLYNAQLTASHNVTNNLKKEIEADVEKYLQDCEYEQ
jgi:hypothetical protein